MARGAFRHLLPDTIHGILVFLLLLIVIPILLIEPVLHYARFEERRRAEFGANLELARALAVGFDSFVTDILRQELLMGVALTAPQSPSPAQMLRVLVTGANAQPAVAYYSWIDPLGRVLASSDLEIVGTNVAKGSHFREVLGGREWVVTDLSLPRSECVPVFFIVRAIHADDGVFVGAVAALVDVRYLSYLLRVERAGRGAIAIVDRQGWAVYRYPEAALTWEERNLAKVQPIVREALQGREETGVFASADGQRWMGGFVPISSIGWVAGASRPEAETMGPLLADTGRELLLYFVVTIAAFLTALFISRGLTRPMRLLRSTHWL